MSKSFTHSPLFYTCQLTDFCSLKIKPKQIIRILYMLLLSFRCVSMNHSNTVSELFEYRMISEIDRKSSKKKSSKKKIALQFTRKNKLSIFFKKIFRDKLSKIESLVDSIFVLLSYNIFLKNENKILCQMSRINR